jgi:hypothetical protein
MKKPAAFTKSGNKATTQVALPKAVFDEIPSKHDLTQAGV